jgi:ferredoxin
MRVVVDYDQCDGNGFCVEAAPDVFALDDEDRLTVRVEHPAEPQWPAVEAAARGCPKLAISLRDTA